MVVTRGESKTERILVVSNSLCRLFWQDLGPHAPLVPWREHETKFSSDRILQGQLPPIPQSWPLLSPLLKVEDLLLKADIGHT